MIKVYGKEFCKYCKKATKLLDEKKWPYEYIDMDEMDFDEAKKIKQDSKMKTVPIIYFEDILIGGYSELTEFSEININEL